MDGWKTSFLLGWLPGRCYVSSRECIYIYNIKIEFPGSSLEQALDLNQSQTIKIHSFKAFKTLTYPPKQKQWVIVATILHGWQWLMLLMLMLFFLAADDDSNDAAAHD